MSLSLSGSNYLSAIAAAPVGGAYPWTIGYWAYHTQVSSSQNHFLLFNGAQNYNVEMGGGGGVFGLNTNGISVTGGTWVANRWYYLVQRACAAASHRLAILDSATGSITHIVNTTNLPVTFPDFYIGSDTGAGMRGHLAEFFCANVDVQPDGGALDEVLLRRLAYRGPFSIQHVKRNIVEYRSFRSRVTHDKPGEVYHVGAGRTWTNVGGATVGPHVRLPPSYASPLKEEGIVTVTSTISIDEGDGTVTISGTETEGSTLTANFANDDPDGSATGITYQWERSGTPIGGATSSTYLLDAADVGETITVVVNYTDGEGFAESIESAATGTIAAAPAASTGPSTKGASLGKGLSIWKGVSKDKGLSWRKGV